MGGGKGEEGRWEGGRVVVGEGGVEEEQIQITIFINTADEIC